MRVGEWQSIGPSVPDRIHAPVRKVSPFRVVEPASPGQHLCPHLADLAETEHALTLHGWLVEQGLDRGPLSVAGIEMVERARLCRRRGHCSRASLVACGRHTACDPPGHRRPLTRRCGDPRRRRGHGQGHRAGSPELIGWQDAGVTSINWGKTVGWVCAVGVVLLGTGNLWKVESLRALLPVDLTLASAAIAAAVALGVWIAAGCRVKSSWLPLVIGFATFAPALAVTSFDHPYSVEKARDLFTLSLLAAAAPMVVLTSEYRRRALLVLMVGLGAVTSLALLVGGTVNPDTGRVGVEDGSPIGLARVACLVIAILGVAMVDLAGKRLLVALGMIVVAAGSTVTTGSRGPLAFAIISPVAVLLLTNRGALHLDVVRRAVRDAKVRARIIAVGGVILLASAALVRFTSALALAHLLNLGGESSQLRVRLWSESIATAARHPLGVGWGDIAGYLSAAARKYMIGDKVYPHNVLVEAAAEGGLLALAGLVFLLVVSWRRLWAAASTLTGRALLSVWIFGVGSAMTSSDMIGNRLMWMMIGVGLAYPQFQRGRSLGLSEEHVDAGSS